MAAIDQGEPRGPSSPPDPDASNALEDRRVITLVRHLVAIAALPFPVTLLVPLWIVRRNAIRWCFGSTTMQTVEVAAGACALLVGLALFTSSLARFAREGKGTLAPWDPPRRLVVSGPYRFVRNPMISGVCFLLLGEAAVLRAAPL